MWETTITRTKAWGEFWTALQPRTSVRLTSFLAHWLMLTTFTADIHIQSVISKDGRAAGFVPRENGLLRFAAPVANRSEATPEKIIQSLKEIISPYEINVSHVDWCGVFGSRRRVSSHASLYSRIFLAGDALHIHSPRAGIGMNFSIQDSKFQAII